MISTKRKTIRIMASLVASNIGIGFISYAGFRIGWWSNETMWRIMMADGCYFCLGSFINLVTMLP